VDKSKRLSSMDEVRLAIAPFFSRES